MEADKEPTWRNPILGDRRPRADETRQGEKKQRAPQPIGDPARYVFKGADDRFYTDNPANKAAR